MCCSPLTLSQTIPSRNYAAEIFQASIPALRHSEYIHKTINPPPTAQALLRRATRRPSLHINPRPPVSQRYLWTSTWKAAKRLTPERITSPLLYARVVRLEQEANASPNNVAKQVTLWRAILDLDTPTAYERIISRWERLLEFVRASLAEQISILTLPKGPP